MLRPGNLQDGSINKKKMKELKDFLKEKKINGSGTQPQLIQVRFGTATARLRRQQSDGWNSRETHDRQRITLYVKSRGMRIEGQDPMYFKAAELRKVLPPPDVI